MPLPATIYATIPRTTNCDTGDVVFPLYYDAATNAWYGSGVVMGEVMTLRWVCNFGCVDAPLPRPSELTVEWCKSAVTGPRLVNGLDAEDCSTGVENCRIDPLHQEFPIIIGENECGCVGLASELYVLITT